MRDEKEERKKQARSNKQTQHKAKQHSTPKAVTFPRKNELPQVGLEPTTLYTLDRALYQLQLSWLGPNLTSHSTPDVHVHVLGVLCCFALFVCLTLLASFFLPSHLSFKNMYMYMYIYNVHVLLFPRFGIQSAKSLPGNLITLFEMSGI